MAASARCAAAVRLLIFIRVCPQITSVLRTQHIILYTYNIRVLRCIMGEREPRTRAKTKLVEVVTVRAAAESYNIIRAHLYAQCITGGYAGTSYAYVIIIHIIFVIIIIRAY